MAPLSIPASLVVLELCAALAPAARAQELFPDRTYPVGDDPGSIVALRLDGDALPDLVTGNNGSLTRMLSHGDGTFEVLPELPAEAVTALLAADMDGDGREDLLSLSRATGHVQAWLNDGSGGLNLWSTSSSAGHTPQALAAGDFDEDGQLDVVVANENSDTVALLAGDGAGGLAAAVTFAVGNVLPELTARPKGIAVADLDEDGHLDVVTANYAFPSTLSLLFGDGAGGFAPSVNFQMGEGSAWLGDAVLVGDVNEDGHVDLVTNNSVRLGDGAGGFLALLPPWGVSARSTVLDFDGDGHLDVVTAYTGSVFVRLGDGQGGLLSSSSHYGGAHVDDVAVVDFEGDGDFDLAPTSLDFYVPNGCVTPLVNDGTAAFQLHFVMYPTNTNFIYNMQTADLDDDGALDIVATNSSPPSLVVLMGDGAAGFQPPVLTSLSAAGGTELDLGDVDGDGDEDAILRKNQQPAFDQLTVLLGDGAGGFQPLPPVATTLMLGWVALGDVNEDGLADLAGVNSIQTGLTVMLSTGGGSLGPPVTTPMVFPISTGPLQLTDLNGDGHLDALITTTGGLIYTRSGDGRGGFGPQVNVTGTGGAIVAADLDGDGDIDLVGTDANKVVAVVRAIPGGYAAPELYPGLVGGVAVGDLDADGDPDLAVVSHENAAFRVLLNDGSATFSAHGTFLAGGQPWLSRIEDLDGNGYGDLLTVCSVSIGILPQHVSVVLGQSESPWLGLGHALGGSQGAPALTGEGTLQRLSPVTFTIEQGKPFGSAVLVVGPAAIDAPFKGGTMVPLPVHLIFGLPLNGAGHFSATGAWFGGLPPGTHVFFQAWIPDAAGPAGFAATNGVKGTTP